MMYRYRAFWLLLALSPQLQAADSCAPDAAALPDWQPLFTRSLVLHLPATAVRQQPASDDSQVDTIRAGGVSLYVERGMPYVVAPREEVPPGAWPLRFSAVAADQPGELAATWNLDERGRDVVRLHLSYRDSRELDLACRIAASARPLGRAADLRLLRIVQDGKQRCALLRDGGLQRRVCTGNQITRDYGLVERIDADAVHIKEVLDNGNGGWREQYTTLRIGGN